MANPYYAPGKERAERVQELFGAISSKYDLVNDLQSFGLHRLWKRKLIRLVEAGAGKRGLDICTGTGDIARGMARSGASVVGVDFSPAMLAVARRKSKPMTPEITWVQGDARALPFDAEQFDIATMAYGLRNLPDPVEGLREMQRVLKPGGRIGILDFGKPRNPVWRGIFLSYLRLGVPLCGRLIAGDAAAYAYILESLRHYPGQEEVAQLMRAEGFVALRVFELLEGIMAIHVGERSHSHG